MKCIAVLAIVLAGCPDVSTDPGETTPVAAGPTVEFDPAAGIIPFPNNLTMCATGVDGTGAPCTIGKLAIPPSPCETAAETAIRTTTLNQLDGFGTFEAATQVTFTEAIDPATLDGNIVMYERTPTVQTIPVTLVATTTLRFSGDACTSPEQVTAVNVIPDVVLDQRATYTIAVLSGVKTTTGADYEPSVTWALVRQADDPVIVDADNNIVSESTPFTPGTDDAKLHALDQLWKAHAPAMQFLVGQGHALRDVLVAWEVTTQTTTDPLDPTVAGSPASALSTDGFAGLASLTASIDRTSLPYSQCGAEPNTTCYLEITLGRGDYATGKAMCAEILCDQVKDVLGGVIASTTYQQLGPTGIPGAWTDPIAPAAQGEELLQAIVFVAASSPLGATAVFGHGLTSSKEALFAIGPRLAAFGVHSIAIDLVNHGSRAIQISSTGACAGTPSPTALPQCFAPFFTSDLAQTRDNLRQSVLDLQRVTNVIASCAATPCLTYQPDASEILYLGQSLGGIIGTTTTGITPAIRAALLNVSAVGLLDVLEHTDTLAIRCGLVDSLIDAGVLVGDKSDGAMPLCADEAWQTQPGYAKFRGIARWVIDPADGASYMSRVAQKPLFLQEVVDDTVVPNYATDLQGALAGLTPLDADLATSVEPLPSTNLENTTASVWLRYTSGNGNTFTHASLLQPANNASDGLFATARLQVDALTFLTRPH
ncbi:MAG: hypothetical protein QM831_29335 [Kofleriaceae bacterium]